MVDSLNQVLEAIKPLDKLSMKTAQSRQDTLTKPNGSLGRLEDLSIQIAGIQGKPVPQIKQKAVIVMAADHGVAVARHGSPVASLNEH